MTSARDRDPFQYYRDRLTLFQDTPTREDALRMLSELQRHTEVTEAELASATEALDQALADAREYKQLYEYAEQERTSLQGRLDRIGDLI